MPRTSGSSDETMTMATPRAGELAQQLVDLALGPDIDAPRRLVDEEHPAVGREATC